MARSSKYNYPKRLPLVKFFLNAEAIRKNPIPFHKDFFTKYGDTFSVRLGRKKYLMLSRDKELVQYILQKNHKNYYKSKIQTNYLSKYLGNGLLTVNGDFWLRQRRLIQPAFHKQKMVSLIALMEATIANQLRDVPTQKEVDVFPIVNQLAFKVVAKSLFNVSLPEDTLTRLQDIIQEIQLFLVKEVRLPHKGWWFKITGQIATHKGLAQESRDIIKSVIDGRRETSKTHDDLLDMLLATRYEDTGEGMSTEQLIDEISIIFVAGHETTANALAFTLWLLARHSEIQEKAYQEIRSLDDQGTIGIDKIQQLRYTKAVIDESMRLYPPAWITDRENLEDDTINDFHIRKDTLVGVSFYELHRNPTYWNNPNDFIPERFLGEARKEHSGAYYPFGAGPRMCIGLGFAVYEMVLAVSFIVKRYELSSSIESIGLNPLITLKPINARVKFKKRT